MGSVTEGARKSPNSSDTDAALALLTYQVNILRQNHDALERRHEALEKDHYNLKATFNKWINWGFGVASAVGFIAITTGYVAGWLKNLRILP